MFQLQNCSLNQCNMSIGHKKGSYSPIQWALSSSVGFFGTSVHTLLCNTVCPSQFCALSVECLALWQHHQLNMSVHHKAFVVDMLGAQVNICPASVESHAPYQPVSIVLHIFRTPSLTGSGFSLVQHITQKSKHTSYFNVCPGSGRLSIFNLTYLWYPLIAVQWHNPRVPITCLNMQSHDTISCQKCCYLIFWNFLVYLSDVELKIWYKEHIHNMEYNWDE